MRDDLGNRIKENYENVTRTYLPRRTYTIIRLDGKAFHTYTKKIKADKPYDLSLSVAMENTTKYLCQCIEGAVMAYTQSDEISLLLMDNKYVNSEAWFGGSVQKMCSVSASMATAYFNNYISNGLLAFFDSRVFTIPDRVEVCNYFIWRQQDAVRNSVQLLAQSLYSHKELQNKNNSELQEMIFQKGYNWNNVHYRFKRGLLFTKQQDKWEDIPSATYTVECLSKLFPEPVYKTKGEL